MDTLEFKLNVRGRSISYFLTPAEGENRSILLIFHGHGYNKAHSAFKSSSYNVACPIDNFGYEGLGSWYLGEKGDFFWLDAMSEILKSLREKTGNGRVYMWGSSMGGYASILYGHLLGASAVYANVPQTFLLGSRYSENGMKKYFEHIFDGGESDYNDLKRILKKRTRCKYFLCFNQLEGSNYFEEQGLRFMEHLHAQRQPMYVEVRPQSAHGKNHGVSDAISLFKKY